MKQKTITDAMLTDLYQLTMAQGYYLSGQDRIDACFTMFYRDNPFKGGFAIAAGIEPALEYLQNFSFSQEDVDYLSTLKAADGSPLFVDAFLNELLSFKFTCDVDAVEEGSVVFAREPLIQVRGPISQCQLVETTLLNILNFSTLIATKSARCVIAAQGDPILEFGLRRAQGPDGGVMASRASYIGGCAATANTLAGQLYGIPVAGTHAHSWVMAFDSEEESFEAYARTSSNNVVLLVDTYNALAGVEKAIKVGLEMEARGEHFAGIRIDSGDLAYLSKEARKMLDEAGLSGAKIYASNELDEYTISSLKDQGAPIEVWGVGTKLVTAFDQPSLGGVYKLTAIRKPESGVWEPRIKISEQANKMTVPGVQGVRRYINKEGTFVGDMVYARGHNFEGEAVMVDPQDGTRRKTFSAQCEYREMLTPLMKEGKVVRSMPSLSEIQAFAREEISHLHETQLRFLNPHSYPVGLEKTLHDTRFNLVLKARQASATEIE